MYSEIIPRMLVGGWVDKNFYVNVLARAGVTHVVNMRHEHLPPIVADQFFVLDCDKAEDDSLQNSVYWIAMLDFVACVYRVADNILYFHMPMSHAQSPVGCYLALRAIGYTPMQCRKKLEQTHPILSWHEVAIHSVENAYYVWCQERGVDPEKKRRKLLEQLKKNREAMLHDNVMEGRNVVDQFV
jgi:hypothetical protein